MLQCFQYGSFKSRRELDKVRFKPSTRGPLYRGTLFFEKKATTTTQKENEYEKHCAWLFTR